MGAVERDLKKLEKLAAAYRAKLERTERTILLYRDRLRRLRRGDTGLTWDAFRDKFAEENPRARALIKQLEAVDFAPGRLKLAATPAAQAFMVAYGALLERALAAEFEMPWVVEVSCSSRRC